MNPKAQLPAAPSPVSNPYMEGTSLARVPTRPKVAVSVLLSSAAISFGLLAANPMAGRWPPELAQMAVGSLALIASVVLQWLRPRLASAIGAFGGLILIGWLVRTEVMFEFCIQNSWIVFNLPDPRPSSKELSYFTIRIITGALLLTATACAAWRLLPQKWRLYGAPLRDRSWPAFAIGVAGVCIWFVCAVSPYRYPMFVDGPAADLRILHTTKNGLQFHESTVALYRGWLFRSRSDRRLFHYRFRTVVTSGYSPRREQEIVQSIASLPEFQKRDAAEMRPLRDWNDEGWYVMIHGNKFEFTKRKSLSPPTQLTALFEELQNVVPDREEQFDEKDICLGFCYDPQAALGLASSGERCRRE